MSDANPISRAVLHARPRSPFSRKVRWVLARKGLDAELRETDAAEVVARFEGSDLPVLELGGRAVAGSRAIAFHLERRVPEPSLFPSDARKRNQAVTLDQFADHALGRLVLALAPDPAPVGGDGAVPAVGSRESLLGELRDAIDQVREAMRRGALDSGAGHLGDIAVAAHLVSAAEIPELRFERDAADLVAYVERIRALCEGRTTP